MKRITLATIQLFLLSIGVCAQGTTTILSEGFESPTFLSTFSKTGNDIWNPGTPGVNDYQSTFWDNLYTPTTSTQTSEISTSEFKTGTQSLKLTVTTAAQTAASSVSTTTYVKFRSREKTLTGNKTTILDWKNYKVTFWAKVTKTDGSSLGTGIVVFPENTTQTVSDNNWHQYTFNSTSAKYSSGLTATKVIISMANNIGEDYIVYIDDVLVQKTDNTWTGTSSIQWNTGGNWSDGAKPTATRNVYIPLTTNKPQVSTTGYPQLCNDLYLASGAVLNFPTGTTELRISAGGQLTNYGTINLNTGGPLSLYSDANGTATLVNNGTIQGAGSVSIQQFLPAIRNWYLTSPVASATAPSTNIARYYEYVEPGNNADLSVAGSTNYWLGRNVGFSMIPGKGYIAQVNAATTLTFSGTINNNSQYEIPVTRNLAPSKAGFNLVGNPYSAYLDWSLVITDVANSVIGTTLWFRTKNTGDAYTFATHNGTSGMTVTGTANTDITKFIPPMQAFWVRVNEGTASTNLTLKKTMLAHSDVIGNKLKAPAAPTSERTNIRLQVSNGTNTDELLIYTDAQASDSFDSYDSPKMSNADANIPEISTIVNGESLVINGLNNLALDTELPIHFMTKTANSFSLKSNELSNLPEGIKVILMDNGTEFDLTNGAEYNFTSDVTHNTNRFSLIFRSPGVSTDLENNKLINKAQVFVNESNQITIIAQENSNYAIYNTTGQLIENGFTNYKLYTVNCKLNKSVYLVKVNNQSTRVIIK